MTDSRDDAQFTNCLRTALVSLYDPAALRGSPLTRMLGTSRQRDPAVALRRLLIDAIESLRPAAGVPPDSRAWRIYQVLRRRYIEQVPQRKVAADLGLSVRQLQREEKLAREMLANHLRFLHKLDDRVAQAISTTPGHERQPPHTCDRELEWIRTSLPPQFVQVDQVIAQALETLKPLFDSHQVRVEYAPHDDLPLVHLQAQVLKQALLHILGIAASGALSRVIIRSAHREHKVFLDIKFASADDVDRPISASPDGLAMAERLVSLCGGRLEVTVHKDGKGNSHLEIRVTLTCSEQALVLVIDDNPDTLHLFRRYLAGTRYRFAGASDARQGMTMAVELQPQIIVVDIMLPEQDGWALLGQLRAHPSTCHIPVIVCTILSQKQLALSLGASDFVRKPVTRSNFLLALDRQMAHVRSLSRSGKETSPGT